jgi:hypothetical protein
VAPFIFAQALKFFLGYFSWAGLTIWPDVSFLVQTPLMPHLGTLHDDEGYVVSSKSIEVGIRLNLVDDRDSTCHFPYESNLRRADNAEH